MSDTEGLDITGAFKKSVIGSLAVFFLFIIVPGIYFYWKADDRREGQLAQERLEAERRLTIENRLTQIEEKLISISKGVSGNSDSIEEFSASMQGINSAISSLANDVSKDMALMTETNRKTSDHDDQLDAANGAIRQLQDGLGDLEADVERVEAVAEQGAQDHVLQQDRAAERAGPRLVRDRRLDDLEAFEKDIQAWRDSSQINKIEIMAERLEYLQERLQVDQGGIFQDQIRTLQAEISAIKNQLPSL